MPQVYQQLRTITWKLEKHYRDMQDFEFTIQDGKLYMLQTRNGKRTGLAAVRVAIDMVREGLITQEKRSCGSSPTSFTTSWFRAWTRRTPSIEVLATGLPASPGAAVGQIVFTAEDAVKFTTKAPTRSSSWSAAKPRPKTSPAWKSPPAFSPRAEA